MSSQENSYFQGVDREDGTIPQYEFVLSLKEEIGIGKFREDKFMYEDIVLYIETYYAGLHLFNPSWYEEGEYKIGILRADLYTELEEWARQDRLLDDDMYLRAECYYSDQEFSPIYVKVDGGEHDSWGQFLTIQLKDKMSIFNVSDDKEYIENFIKGIEDFKIS